MPRRQQIPLVVKRIYKPDPVAEMKAIALVLGIPWSAIDLESPFPAAIEQISDSAERADNPPEQPGDTIAVPDAS
jgi:hypothetical protein